MKNISNHHDLIKQAYAPAEKQRIRKNGWGGLSYPATTILNKHLLKKDNKVKDGHDP